MRDSKGNVYQDALGSKSKHKGTQVEAGFTQQEECSCGACNREEVSWGGRAVGVRLLMDSNGFGKALENAKQNTDIF